MALRTYQLTLAATQKRVSDVYGGAAGVQDPKTDIPYRQLTFQAEGATYYLGMDNTVATSNYGSSVLVGAGGEVRIGPFDQGPVHLSDFYAVGAGATLHVSGIPF